MSRWQTALARAKQFDPRNIPGLVAWWKFDEDATTTNVNATDSVGGYTLTASGGPMAATGRTGRARRLRSGTNLTTNSTGFTRGAGSGSPAIAQDQSMTFAVWLKPEYSINTGGTSSTPAMFGFRCITNPNTEQIRFGYGLVPTYQTPMGSRIQYSDGTFTSLLGYISSSSLLPEGVWSHIAITVSRENNLATMYLNGAVHMTAALSASKVIDGIGPGLGVVNINYPGLVEDLTIYGRALLPSEVARLAGAPARPTPVSSLHIEAECWVGRVVGSGGSVSLATAQAVSDFCTAIDAAGIRDRFYRLNLFCGTADASLIAVRTPLYRGQSLAGAQYGNTLDTNVNFAITDYAEAGASGGLVGNGINRYLNTGLAPSALPSVATMHLAAYRGPGTTSNRHMIATQNATDRYELFRRGDGVHHALLGGQTTALDWSEPSVNAGGFYIATRTGATSLSLRRNATFVGANTTSTTPASHAFPFFVFAGNSSGTVASGSYWPFTLMAYSIGDGLTDAQANAYNTAMQAFQTALGRNV